MSAVEPLDFDRLLSPITAGSPAGADLRQNDTHGSLYSVIKDAWRESTRIERKHKEDPKQEEYQLHHCSWDQVVEKSLQALSSASKDFEIAAWLCEGLLRQRGYGGLRDGLRLARLLAERYWDSLYPSMEGDRRVARFCSLFETALVLPVREVPLTRNSQCTDLQYEQARRLEDIRDAAERTAQIKRLQETGIEILTLQQITQEAADTSANFYRGLVADLEGCVLELEQLASLLSEKCSDDANGVVVPAPKKVIGALRAVLTTIQVLAGDKLSAGQEEAVGEEEAGENAVNDAGPAPGHQQGMTREVALRQITELAAFFRRTEPHSPIPIHLEEAVRWGHMPLENLLAELISEKKVLNDVFTRIGFPSSGEG